MGKKKSSNIVEAVPVSSGGGGASVSSSAAATGGGGESSAATTNENESSSEVVELLQVDVGDMVKLKQVLDESVAEAILEYFPEDTAWDNRKLWIMFLACVFAMVAQFAPIPFPESRPVLGVCGAMYFCLSGVLQLITTFVDKDAILWTTKLPASTESTNNHTHKYNQNPEFYKHGLVVRSSFPRFSEFYTITIELQPEEESETNKKNHKTNPVPNMVTQTWSIGQFFDKEGYFDEMGLNMEIEKLLQRLDRGQYDKTTSDANNKNKKE
jgi:signal peptidase complex subunit 2